MTARRLMISKAPPRRRGSRWPLTRTGNYVAAAVLGALLIILSILGH